MKLDAYVEKLYAMVSNGEVYPFYKNRSIATIRFKGKIITGSMNVVNTPVEKHIASFTKLLVKECSKKFPRKEAEMFQKAAPALVVKLLNSGELTIETYN